MSSLIGFRPHYIFRPSQLLRRLSLRFRSSPPRFAFLPWGLNVAIGADSIGQEIARTGVFDLLVTETLLRLAGEGEMTVDVGGNIGYMTSVLAKAVGRGGTVLTIEPHPVLFGELRENIARWPRDRIAAITPMNVAVSEYRGTARLNIGGGFAQNRGTASLENSRDCQCDHGIEVPVSTLDDLIHSAVGVLKIDIEGHELSAFRGATRLLKERAIRDIVFEDYSSYPTPVASMLESAGYSVFRISGTTWGPELVDPSVRPQVPGAPNYLATRDPARARDILCRRGWRSLRKRHSSRI